MIACPNCRATRTCSTVTAEFRQLLRKRLRLHKGQHLPYLVLLLGRRRESAPVAANRRVPSQD